MLVHADKVRWLAWLRVKMLTRGFRRRPAVLVGTIIGMLFLLFGAAWLAFILYLGLTALSPTATIEVVYLLFTGLLLFWIALPLLSYSTNEGLDITKLQLFPLTRLEIMLSLLFSSLFDVWTVLLFVLFATTIVGLWLHSLALGLLTALVVVIFYVTMVGISQLVLALLMRTLQSRRFRDLSIIIIALFSSSCYLVNRFIFSASNITNFGVMLDKGGFSPYLQWLPSGVAAGAVRAAMQGNWGSSFALLGLLVVIAAAALYLWQLVLERSLSASESSAARKAKQRTQPTALAVAYQAGAAASAPAIIPSRNAPALAPASPSARPAVASARTAQAVPAVSASVEPGKANLVEQLQALVRKELICYWRDPILKVRIVQTLLPLIIVFFFNISGGREGSFYSAYLPFFAVLVIFFFMLSIALNTLGIERQSLTTLFLFPIDRRRLLWGKNLAVLLMGLTALIVLLILSVALSRLQMMVLPAAVIGLAGMGVTLGCANMVSVFFPHYQPPTARRSFAGSGSQAQSGGCLNAIMSFVGVIVTLLLLAPVALGIGIPFFLNLSIAWLISMPLSLVYGVILYIVLTNFAARRMLATEPEILAVTTRE